MPKSELSWLVVRALDELDWLYFFQEFISIAIEEMDKPTDAEQRCKRVDMLLTTYEESAKPRLEQMRENLEKVRQELDNQHQAAMAEQTCECK